MSNALLAPVMLVVACAFAAASAGETATAVCESSSHGGPCKIAWNFTEVPGAEYWVEQFDPESEGWDRVYGPASHPSGTTEKPVPDGFLYRVVACTDQSGPNACTTSSVHWAPVHPTNADAIPELIKKDGDKWGMQVGKNLSFEGQRQQYNVYLLMLLVESIDDWSSLPPMTEPPVTPESPESRQATATYDDRIHHAVYGIYTDARSRSRAVTR